jgi:hypothetical protein
VASEYFLAALTQLGPVLLQALLNRAIIYQLLSAKALSISSAGLLLFRRAHVTLCKDSGVPVSKMIRMSKIERIASSLVGLE